MAGRPDIIETARVILWGVDVGAVTWVPDRAVGVFQYTPEFARSGIELSPLMMPLTGKHSRAKPISSGEMLTVS